jgi:hypothetical protein
MSCTGRGSGRKICLTRPSSWIFRPSTRKPCPTPCYRCAIALVALTRASYRLIASCPSAGATCGASALSVRFSPNGEFSPARIQTVGWTLSGFNLRRLVQPLAYCDADGCRLGKRYQGSPLPGQIGRMAPRPPNGVTAWLPPPICHGLESLARLFQPEQKNGPQ